ncbi:MAG: YicC/YloC family endoribonuclease [Thiohalomonadales bacterium]
MIKSMTAFARQTIETEIGQLTWEIRSVNHRYSEVSLRIADDFRSLEPKIREQVTKMIKRGKLDLNLRLQNTQQDSNNGLLLDKHLVQHLAAAAAELGNYIDKPQPLSVADLLRWPGIFKTADTDTEKLQQQALALLQQTLQELVSTRQREGAQMQKVIAARCTSIRHLIVELKEILPEIITTIRQRVQSKLEEYAVEVDPGRLEQEIVIMANRADVAEEIDRLDAHIIEIERVLQQDQPVGRRLDFLMQELNREANTLGSKSISTTMSQSSVELKVLIEQMREQIQNIE